MDRTLKLLNDSEAAALFGRHDEHLKLVEKELGLKIVARGEDLTLSGSKEAVEQGASLFEQLLVLIRRGAPLHRSEVSYAVRAMRQGHPVQLHDIYLDKIEVSSRRGFVIPKTRTQKEYVDAIRKFDIVFGIGPAGTGKSYLAVAMAVHALRNQEVSRIILTRPAVEAGESLGYLPGTMLEKIAPYLRPLYDALYDMMEPERVERYMATGIIEVAPLAYMRGRTLNDAYIILDEAQNTTPEQMKMFLTRLGFDSKTVITGDLTQSDLPNGKPAGLLQVSDLLKGIERIQFVYFTGEDVVRHPLVMAILEAYDRWQKEKPVLP